MSFDYTTITEENCPWRWRRVADWLQSDTNQLDRLSDDYKALLNFVHDKDFGDVSAPGAPSITLLSKTATSATFRIAVADSGATKVYMDMDSNEWDGTTIPSASSDPNTDITSQITGGLSFGTWVKTSLTAGDHYAFTFSAEDSSGEGVGSANARVILQPPVPASPGAAEGTNSGELDISWDAANGAETYTYMYLEGTGKTEEEIITDGTSASTANTSATLALTADTDYCVIVRATNPGGSSAWTSVFEGTSKA